MIPASADFSVAADSGYKDTPCGVELLSSAAATEQAEEAGIRRTFYANVHLLPGPGPKAVTLAPAGSSPGPAARATALPLAGLSRPGAVQRHRVRLIRA